MKTKFVVESVNTFFEMHLVEAENKEEAKNIALNSDYNASKHIGVQVTDVHTYTEDDLTKMKRVDSYVFQGYSALDAEGRLVYYKLDGTLNDNMPKEYVDFTKK